MKKLSWLICVVMLVAGLMGSLAGAEERVTVRFAGWAAMEEITAYQFYHLVELFEQANPNIRIEYEGVAWENTRTQLLMQHQAGNPPDAAQIAAPWIGQFAYAGAIAPLEDMVAPEILANYVPNVVDEYTFLDHTWGLPWVAVHACMIYNRPLMEQAGLDTAVLPLTVEEYDAVARAMAALGTDEAGNKIWGLTTATDRSELSANIFTQWLYNFAGAELDEDGLVAIDNDQAIEALSWLKSLVDDQVMPGGFSFRDQYTLFAGYQSGSFTDGSYCRGAIGLTSGKGEAVYPEILAGMMPTTLDGAGDPSQHKTIFHHHTLVVFEGSPHQEEALKFIQFLSTDPEGTLFYAQESSLYPLYLPALEDPYYQQDEYVRTFVKALPGATLYEISKTPHYASAVDAIALAVSRAFSGEDPKTVLSECAEELRRIYTQ